MKAHPLRQTFIMNLTISDAFLETQLLLLVDYKDQIHFFLKKNIYIYYHWQLQRKVMKDMTEVFLQGS